MITIFFNKMDIYLNSHNIKNISWLDPDVDYNNLEFERNKIRDIKILYKIKCNGIFMYNNRIKSVKMGFDYIDFDVEYNKIKDTSYNAALSTCYDTYHNKYTDEFLRWE